MSFPCSVVISGERIPPRVAVGVGGELFTYSFFMQQAGGALCM
jgi:hypothetical protein